MAVKDGLPSTDFSRQNREYIKAVAEGGSGDGGLPEITEADEGKVLGVENGEAAWVEGGGGGADIVMTTVSPVDGNLQMDKTFAEIKAAILAGKIVIINIPYSETDYTSVERYVASFYENTGLTPEYVVNFMNTNGEVQNYFSSSESGYPVLTL